MSKPRKEYLSELKSLVLKNTDSSLVRILSLSKLISIDLSSSELTKEIADKLSFSNVESFFLRNPESSFSWEFLRKFGPKLREIDLSGSGFRFDQKKFLNESVNLQNLFLSNLNISDLDLQQNLDLAIFKNLIHLDLSFNRISELHRNKSEFIEAAAFENLISLEELNLSYNFLTSIDQSIFGENSLSHLKIFRLKGDPISARCRRK